MDFKLDATLIRGLEITPKIYVTGINKAIEMISDFYNDFRKQEYFYMNERTGLHINIGYENITYFNILKGLVFLADVSKNELPFVYKDMVSRVNSEYTRSIIDRLYQIINDMEATKRFGLLNVIDKVDIHNLELVEKKYNSILLQILQDTGRKKFGFNFDHVKDNYIEYRYVGDSVPENVLIDKMLYFCYITYLMVNPEYKRKEYHKKLYKFIDSLKDEVRKVRLETKNKFLRNVED